MKKNMHPAAQIVSIMERIYKFEMTTISGGNLSLIDEKGDMWITPSGVDKGNLTVQDIMCLNYPPLSPLSRCLKWGIPTITSVTTSYLVG